ncbi:hypothetical protein BMS3Bbin03_01664 [bacterium BMS3Bbin03]|nr:hypothetical protein BMS3Bbin03_01664 [bacterium BMS3Bbin03]
MKKLILITILIILPGFSSKGFSQTKRIDFSITLSGAILYGIDYHYSFNAHSAIRAGVYVGVEKRHFVPGIHANYQYTFLPGNKFSPYIGVGPDFMLTTDSKKGWRHLTLLKFPVGGVYKKSEKTHFGIEIWPVYFFAKKKPVPLIGISGIFSRKW